MAGRVEALAKLSELAGRWVLGLPRYDEPWAEPGAARPSGGMAAPAPQRPARAGRGRPRGVGRHRLAGPDRRRRRTPGRCARVAGRAGAEPHARPARHPQPVAAAPAGGSGDGADGRGPDAGARPERRMRPSPTSSSAGPSRLVSGALQQRGAADAAAAHRARPHRRAGRHALPALFEVARDALPAAAGAPAGPEGAARRWLPIPTIGSAAARGLPKRARASSRRRSAQMPDGTVEDARGVVAAVRRARPSPRRAALASRNLRTTAFRSPTSAVVARLGARRDQPDGRAAAGRRACARRLHRRPAARARRARPAHFELDIPLWSFLKEEAPDWLLPGAGDSAGGPGARAPDQSGLRGRASGRRQSSRARRAALAQHPDRRRLDAAAAVLAAHRRRR